MTQRGMFVLALVFFLGGCCDASHESKHSSQALHISTFQH